MVCGHNAACFGALAVAIAAFGLLYETERPGSTAPLDLLVALNKLGAAEVNVTIALGYNVCLDLVVRAADVLELDEGAAASSADHSRIHSEVELNQAFMHYFRDGAAAERSCEHETFSYIAQRAGRLASARKSLGGNAALMARRLAVAAPGARVMLGGHVGPDAASLLPASVETVTPLSETDEIHLILEYGRGETIGGLAAPRANRFIATADESNTDVEAMISTIQAAARAQADVLVLAGLHMLEPLAPELRAARLQSIRGALDAAAAPRAGSPPMAVHIELASSAHPGFTRAIAEALFPAAHSIGLNEQEAAFLYEATGGEYGSFAAGQPESRDQVAATSPHRIAVALLLRFLIETYPSLSRVHFHALPFHLIAYRSKAMGGVRWRGRKAAVAAGSVAATLTACQAEGVEDAAALGELRVIPTEGGPSLADPRTGSPAVLVSPARDLSGPYSVDSVSPALAWRWASTAGDDIYFAFAPVAVCAKPRSTVGLGDAISASGLGVDAVRAATVATVVA